MKTSKKAKIITAICAVIGFIIGLAYYPIYAAAWILHKVARLVLALCYFLMFKWRMGSDIIKTLFVKYEGN